MKEKDILYIFVHIPKSGGKTIVRHIEEKYKREEIIRLYEWTDGKFTDIEYLKMYLGTLDEEKKRQTKIIIGHDLFYGIHEFFPEKDCRYITFMRHPIERLRSHYNYCYGLPRYALHERPFNYVFWADLYKENELLSFEEWTLKQDHLHDLGNTRNFILEFFQKRGFIESQELPYFDTLIRKFYFIGITERSEEDFLYFYHLLGITKFFPNQNTSTKKSIPTHSSPHNYLHLFEQNLNDIQFYHYCEYKNSLSKKGNLEFHSAVRIITRKRKRSLFVLKTKIFLFSMKESLKTIVKMILEVLD